MIHPVVAHSPAFCTFPHALHPDSLSCIKTKALEDLSLLRPIVHDTSKTAKITWFLLVLHWAVDVIEVIYYIHDPMKY